MQIIPYGDKILVRSMEALKSDVIKIVEDESRRPMKGEVVALNKDHNADSFVEAGDVIVFGRHVAEKIPDSVGEEKLYIIVEPDIWYKVKGKPIAKEKA